MYVTAIPVERLALVHALLSNSCSPIWPTGALALHHMPPAEVQTHAGLLLSRAACRSSALWECTCQIYAQLHFTAVQACARQNKRIRGESELSRSCTSDLSPAGVLRLTRWCWLGRSDSNQAPSHGLPAQPLHAQPTRTRTRELWHTS